MCHKPDYGFNKKKLSEISSLFFSERSQCDKYCTNFPCLQKGNKTINLEISLKQMYISSSFPMVSVKNI